VEAWIELCKGKLTEKELKELKIRIEKARQIPFRQKGISLPQVVIFSVLQRGQSFLQI
jgi:hypothetical protein